MPIMHPNSDLNLARERPTNGKKALTLTMGKNPMYCLEPMCASIIRKSSLVVSWPWHDWSDDHEMPTLVSGA